MRENMFEFKVLASGHLFFNDTGNRAGKTVNWPAFSFFSKREKNLSLGKRSFDSYPPPCPSESDDSDRGVG